MNADDRTVSEIARRAMVARIATVSRHGRPTVTPIYFTYLDGRFWLGTVDWTLAARNAGADPRVSLLLEVERDASDTRILRIRGRATVRTDSRAHRSYRLRVARKYLLTPAGLLHMLAHARQLRLMHDYHSQDAERSKPCVIEVVPEQAELLHHRH